MTRDLWPLPLSQTWWAQIQREGNRRKCWSLIVLMVWWSSGMLPLSPRMDVLPFSWIWGLSDTRKLSLSAIDSCSLLSNSNKIFFCGNRFSVYFAYIFGRGLAFYFCFKGLVGACGISVLCSLMSLPLHPNIQWAANFLWPVWSVIQCFLRRGMLLFYIML